jgi:hypothetical protein
MWFRACLLGFCFVDGAQAAYDAEDSLKLNADVNYQYDTNLFKLDENSSNAQVDRRGERSDSKVEARLGGRLDLKLSRQLISLTADVNQISYQNFKELNHSEWNAGISWDWVIGHSLSGQLNASTSTKMSSFEDGLLASADNSALDMQRQNSLNFQGILKLKSTIHLIAMTGISTEEHDLKQYLNAKNTMASLAARYRSEKGSFISARHSWRKYTYDLDLPFRAGFTEQASSIDIGYSPTTKIDLNLSLGISHWVSAYAGETQITPQGELGISWRATDKTLFKIAYGQSFSEFTSGVGRNLDRHIGLTSKWRMTDKIGWDLDLNRRERSLEVAGISRLNEENTNSMRLGLAYKAVTALNFTSYLLVEQRSSDTSNSNYLNYQFGLNAGIYY